MKKIVTVLIICFLASLGQAQSIERQVISSYGSITSTTSSTVGEVITETKTVNGSFTINQGFQQTKKEIETGLKDISIKVDYTLYPNPSTDVLNVELNTQEAAKFYVYIINSLGQQMSPKTNVLIDGNWENAYTVSSYADGVYFLIIEDASGKQYQSMQFIKK